MSRFAPPGHVYVLSGDAHTHIAAHVFDVSRLPALCGDRPSHGYDRIGGRRDAEARWYLIRREIESTVYVCPRCAEIAGDEEAAR